MADSNIAALVDAILLIPNVIDVRVFSPNTPAMSTWAGENGVVFAMAVTRPKPDDPDFIAEIHWPVLHENWSNPANHSIPLGKIGNLVNPPTQTKSDLKEYAAFKRRQVRDGGIVVNGIPVRTNPETRAEIGLAKADADVTPNWTTQWKLGNGTFITLNAVIISALQAAVSLHVRAAFAAEQAICAAIDNDTITTQNQIDNYAGWPSNE